MKIFIGDQDLDDAVSVYAGGYAAAVYAGDTRIWPTHSVTTVFSTAGSHSYTFPTWFRLGIDFLDVVTLGGGGGGYYPGTGGTLVQNPTNGGASTVVVPTASGNVAVSGDGGEFNSQSSSNASDANGHTASPLSYQWITYSEAVSGRGGNGVVVTASVVGRGGDSGSWDADTLQPTGSITVTVGAGGLPRIRTVGAGSPGAPGKIWIIAYPAEG